MTDKKDGKLNISRADKGLAFMLQYENVAWFDGSAVRILDRRIYPAETKFVYCRTYREVAEAIRDMVTQSAGPFSAAAMGMALAASECRGMSEEGRRAFLKEAADCISTARPTTEKRMRQVTDESLRLAEKAFASGADPAEALFEGAVEANERRYRRIEKAGIYLAELLPASGGVLTQCFGETIVGMMLRHAERMGKRPSIYCCETRPYFQGARLTATVCRDMGADVTVITDNAPAFLMRRGMIELFTSAADAICLDGHVVNKIGTYQYAIAADVHGIPYYVSGSPDIGHPSASSIKIEERNPEFVLQAMGVRTAAEGVKGYYPSFDVTPPRLVTGVVTDLGVYSPHELEKYFEDGGSKELAV